jgi:hypothetical protein
MAGEKRQQGGGAVVQTIKTTIDIGASPEMVWRVLTDFATYPKWNPFLRGVQGDLVPGKRLKIRARLSRTRTYRFSPRVLKAVPAMELCWRGKWWIKGLFDAEHAFIIVPNGVDAVKFIQREHFSGLFVPLIFPFIRQQLETRFDLMNKALKKAAESRH